MSNSIDGRYLLASKEKRYPHEYTSDDLGRARLQKDWRSFLGDIRQVTDIGGR